MLIIETTLIHVLGCTYASFSGIYIIYIYVGSCWAISQYPRLDLGFLRPRSNPRSRRAILLYVALRGPIYTLHIYIYMHIIYIYTKCANLGDDKL